MTSGRERLVSNGAKVAVAVGAGYLLGRTRKMRIAMMLAAAGITGKFPAMPAGLLAQGLKSLGGSEQLHDLTDQLRGEVLTAAKAATLAAATNRVDALNDRLQGVVPTEDVGRAAGSATRGLTAATGRGRRARDEDDQSEDSYGDEEPLDVEEEDLEDIDDEDIDDEDTDDDEGFEDGDPEDDDLEEQDLEDDLEGEAGDDEDDEPPPPRRRATRRAATPRTSTRRSRTTAADRDGEPTKAPSRRGRASAATKRAPVRRGR
jgi:hypothetical protein